MTIPPGAATLRIRPQERCLPVPTDNWKRLGDLLVRRRIEMDPRYSVRQLFAAERGINYRTVSDIERGRRDNYEDTTLTAVEVAYGVTPGSVAAALDGGPLEPLPPVALTQVPDVPPDPSASPSEAALADLLRRYREDPAVQALGAQSAKKAAMRVLEILEWLDWLASRAGNASAGLQENEHCSATIAY